MNDMKPDEKLLLDTIKARTTLKDFPYVRDLVKELGMNEKRASYILEKWTDKGIYSYGVSPFAGWLIEFENNPIEE
jgi:hypothetical protein